jgi:lysophospholipid acyltransferase 5
MLSVVSLGRIGTKIGVAEEAFLLFISLLISYPICIIFNKYLLKQNNNIKHVYYLICGLLLVYFNFGSDIIHSLINCLVCYLVLKLFNIKIAVVINFLFTLIYLLIGCYSIQIGSNYSIKWTLPHCVLTLRLIAISFDIYDGFHNQKINISKDEVLRLKLNFNYFYI